MDIQFSVKYHVQVRTRGEGALFREACAAVEKCHCQAHWFLNASSMSQQLCFFKAFCRAISDGFFKVRQKLQTEKFDFDRFKRRHVLLRVSYFGWDYMGFATQVM